MSNKLDQVYDKLVAGAEALGLTPPRVIPRGSNKSQTYEFFQGKRSLLLLALRSVAQDPTYSGKNRLWVEGLDAVVEHYSDMLKAGLTFDRLPPAVALVLDNQTGHLVVIPLRDLATTHLRRIREVGADQARFTFMLHRRKADYVLEGAYGAPNVGLKFHESVTPIVNVLRNLLQKESRATVLTGLRAQNSAT